MPPKKKPKLLPGQLSLSFKKTENTPTDSDRNATGTVSNVRPDEATLEADPTESGLDVRPIDASQDAGSLVGLTKQKRHFQTDWLTLEAYKKWLAYDEENKLMYCV